MKHDDVEKEVQIEFAYDPSKYDASNQLIIETKKDKAVNKDTRKSLKEAEKSILSKKKKKELEKILDKKQKTANRNDLWEQLRALSSETKTENLSSTLPVFNRNRHREHKLQKHASAPKKLKPVQWNTEPEEQNKDSSSSEESSSESELEIKKEEEEQEFEVQPVIATVKETENPDPEIEAVPAKFIIVDREPEIQTARLLLPIVGEECKIMEKVSESDCIILCGSTGCGKTTQMPQFLYEGGYTRDGYKIGITEPRRVAAMAMSERVAQELNLTSKEVSYHIRFEKNTTKRTQIKFMTDGVLLQEIKNDFELSEYSVIIVDEAHERTLFTDVLLGLLSMIVRLRRQSFDKGEIIKGKLLPPLKLIIMSATLSVDEFAYNRRLFPPQTQVKKLAVMDGEHSDEEEASESRAYPGSPSVLSVESRQYPVTCHFAKYTNPDYLKSAFQKICKIHREEASGTILAFVTGQQEAITLCKWLKEAFPKPSRTAEVKKEEHVESKENKALNLDNIIPTEEEMELCSISVKQKTDAQDTASDSEDEDIDEEQPLDDDLLSAARRDDSHKQYDPVFALPLYSLLPAAQQRRVFEPPPEGHRMVVVSTNVAETSLTIPDVRYVVDTGKEKVKRYNFASGASWFEVVWVSQASAEQRAGRAGRVGPGRCFRLYSARIFGDMDKFPRPDILTRPIDDVVLMLKSYLGPTPLHRFPLPTCPSFESIQSAQQRLLALGALQVSNFGTKLLYKGEPVPNYKITQSGQWMSNLPVSVRLARMLLYANQCELLPYAVVIVAALTVPNLFSLNKSEQEDQASPSMQEIFVRQFVRNKHDLLLGDFSIILGTLCCLERFYAQLHGLVEIQDEEVARITNMEKGTFCKNVRQVVNPDDVIAQLCLTCGVRFKAYKEFRQLRRQLTEVLNANIAGLKLDFGQTVLQKPTEEQVDKLRQLVLVASPCHLAQKIFLKGLRLPQKDRKRLRYAYKAVDVTEPVFIHHQSPINRENFPIVAFMEMHTTSKPFLTNVCAVDPQWIPFLAPESINVRGVLTTPEEEVTGMAKKGKRVAENVESSKSSKKAKHNSESEPDSDEEVEEVQEPEQKALTEPSYDAEHDQILVSAKEIIYTGAGHRHLVKEEGESLDHLESAHSFPLPNSLRFPLVSQASFKSMGEDESYSWGSRWFARALLQGDVFRDPHPLSRFFPKKIKTSLSTKTLTASWGLVRPEVRKLVSILVAKKVHSKQSLLECSDKDKNALFDAVKEWISPESRAELKSCWLLKSDS